MIRAAAEVLAERGLAETRTGDIAERAGMSPGHVMYHFGSKAEILREALALLENEDHHRVTEALAEISDPWARLQRFFELMAPRNRKEPIWRLWLEVWAASLRDPEVAAAGRRLSQRWIETAADLVRSGQAGGTFRAEAVPAEVAAQLLATLDGRALHYMVGLSSSPRKQIIEGCMAIAHLELDPR